MKRGDLIEVGDTQYIVVEMRWHEHEEPRLMAWEFEAWANGFYDAYRPFDMSDDEAERQGYYGGIPSDEVVVKGNIYDNPELLPTCCDGYNGEPTPVKIETIWENSTFK